MSYDNGSVIFDLEQWELDELYQTHGNEEVNEYFSFTTEQELD